MIEYNGIAFIGYMEEWRNITYKDILPDRYEVSNLGRFRNKKTGKLLFGNNRKNERGGYCRIALKTVSGKTKKFQMHRIVMHEFGDLDDDAEVNHMYPDKRDNSIYNLENVSRKENAEHAAIHDLYKSCENHYRSKFTNTQVEEICRYLQDGKPVSEIISIMNLEDMPNIYSNIDKIINGKSWVRISSKYNFDYNKYHYKTYSYDDILKMCEYIFTDHLKNAEIVAKFPQYDPKKLKTCLKSIRHGRIYKNIVQDYLKIND